ncbi:MAG: hypothetical protein MUE73_00475 [Planctomycetes bacterium]|jgi:hypothetical protein|nr:hypothetical protein [Planctomycetota bacterium]
MSEGAVPASTPSPDGHPPFPAFERKPGAPFSPEVREYALLLAGSGVKRRAIARVIGATTEAVRTWVKKARKAGTMPKPPVAHLRRASVPRAAGERRGRPKGHRGDTLRESVRMALEKGEREAVLAPHPLDHHDQHDRVCPAGFFLPKRVASYVLDAKSAATAFASPVGVRNPIFREIDQVRWPYRSVEVRSYEPQVFSNLALLDNEGPYFRLPLLIIGDRRTRPAWCCGTAKLVRFGCCGADRPKPELRLGGSQVIVCE